MLAIRLQRTGRSGHSQFRVIVQDAARSPKSGRVVARLGHYDPHAKTVVIDKEKAEFYLKNGAQPSARVVTLLQAEKVKLPDWVEKSAKKDGKIRNPDKLRRNRPAEEAAPAPEENTPTDESAAAPAEEPTAPAEEKQPEAAEAPAEEPSSAQTSDEEVSADKAEKPADSAE